MCGIVGYTGDKQAQPILLNSLSRLEYRGYDSCGIALAGSGITIYKDAVRVSELALNAPHSPGKLGIGHTRWATHGIPCQVNAHPHSDCTGRIAVVHNGVITNYQQIRQQLTAEGHRFKSETDTEVIPHLIEKYYRNNPGSPDGESLVVALSETLRVLEGSFALIILVEDEPGLAFARQDSPLILGIGNDGYYLASDTTAILEYTDRVIYLENGDSGFVTPESVRIFQDGHRVDREVHKVLWSAAQSQKHGYEHYMLKEIHEQPHIIRDCIAEYLSLLKAPFDFRSYNGNGNLRSLALLACGTSYHAALVGKYIGERITDITIRTELASEYNYYQNPQFIPVAVGITQSGETADTLKAMRRMKENGSRVVAITNVFGSTASRISDHTIYLNAGPEISVAATKSFTAQLTALVCLFLLYSNVDINLHNELIAELRRLPDKLQRVIGGENIVASSAVKLAEYDHIIYIGRGINYGIAMEGALKLKEVSYIYSEAYAAGEIKHGPLALLGREMPVVAIVARDNSYEAMLTNIKEIKSRGSPVFAIAEEDDDRITGIADYVIPVPRSADLFSPFTNVAVVQLLAYFTAKQRRCPIDFPRHLAKSVTVE